MRDVSTFGLTPLEKIIVKTFKEMFRFYRLAPQSSMAAEHDEFPAQENSVSIDVPVLEYVRRLAAEGYTPDLSLIKYTNRHWYDHDQQRDAFYLRALERYGSWEKILERAADSIELRVFPKTMAWRENYIIDRVEELLATRENKKVAMFNGDYHVGGLVSILLKKGWKITYSNNLELRDEDCAAF